MLHQMHYMSACPLATQPSPAQHTPAHPSHIRTKYLWVELKRCVQQDDVLLSQGHVVHHDGRRQRHREIRRHLALSIQPPKPAWGSQDCGEGQGRRGKSKNSKCTHREGRAVHIDICTADTGTEMAPGQIKRQLAASSGSASLTVWLPVDRIAKVKHLPCLGVDLRVRREGVVDLAAAHRRMPCNG